MTGIEKSGSPAKIQRTGNDWVYGSGVDGNVTISANTTLTSDAYYNNLTVNSNVLLNTNGFRVFVKNTLTLNGFIGVGSVSGGVIGEPSSDVSGAATATNQITYRLGGSAGGSTSTSSIPVIPSFLMNDINNISRGVFADTGSLVTSPSGFKAITGGAAGTVGSTGTTTPALTNSDSWPGKAGAAGSPGSATGTTGIPNPYKDTVGVPGGKGNPGESGTATGATSGPGGAGGTGGTGGPVVCVMAKTVVGSGKFVALGRSGEVGSAGSYGSAGTQGANGAAAPDAHYHVPDTTYTPTFIPAHTNHYYNHSDFHGHAIRQHHPNPDAHCCQQYDHSHNTHYGGHTHHVPPSAGSNHHHYGARHHPHNDGPHGGAHHWNPHWWHAYFQITHHYPFPHYHSKPNGHHTDNSGPGHAHRRDLVYHGNFGHHHGNHGGPTSHNNNQPNGNDFGYHTHDTGHSPQEGGHGHSPHHAPLYHYHLASPTPNPPGKFTGGAGGVNDGINYGAAAPAVQGGTGKRGGAGGGGVVLLVTDSVSGTITYDTRAGLTDSSDTYSAANGAAYVIVNS